MQVWSQAAAAPRPQHLKRCWNRGGPQLLHLSIRRPLLPRPLGSASLRPIRRMLSQKVIEMMLGELMKGNRVFAPLIKKGVDIAVFPIYSVSDIRLESRTENKSTLSVESGGSSGAGHSSHSRGLAWTPPASVEGSTPTWTEGTPSFTESSSSGDMGKFKLLLTLL